MTSPMKFWDKMADGYSKKPVPDETVYKIKKELTREYLTPESRVFEFGCGTGTTAISHALYVKDILATDISPEMLSIAKKRAVAAGTQNVTFKQWDVEADPLPGTDYNVVLALSIFHLVNDLPAVLEKCHNMLCDEGVLVSSTGCLADKKNFLRPILGFLKWIGKVPYIAFLNTETFEESLEAAGFQTVHRWLPEGSDTIFIISRKRKVE